MRPQQASAARRAESLEVFREGGYFSWKDIVAGERAGRTPNVRKEGRATMKEQDRYGKQDFSYLLGKVSTFAPQVSD